MEKLNIDIKDLEEIFNYVSESIIISDDTHNIIAVNDASINKLYLNRETIYTKTLYDYIPENELYKVKDAIAKNINDYYEVVLKRENNELFPALVSGKELVINNKKYRVSTILDVTALKNKEQELIAKSKEQLKQLKQHVITKVTSSTQTINKIKTETNEIVAILSEENLEKEHKLLQLNKKIKLLINENNNLSNELEKTKKESFSFEDILDLEVSKSKILKLNFSLAMVAIEDYDDLKNELNKKSKLDIVLSAIKRQFKGVLRNIDTLYYDTDGIFYMILPNFTDFNITHLVDKLVIPKTIEHDTTIKFTYGIAHFYEKDDSKDLLYRVKKNFETNQNENKKEKD